MAVTYGYFNSINGDRKYNADQMSDYFRGIVNEGVFQHLNGGLAVVAGTGMEVTVATGRAIVQNKWVQNDAAFPLTIEAASDTYGRKDAVVIRLSYTNRAISIVVKTGTPSASPAAPSLTRSSTTYEMALAYVNVSAGATSVTVTDKRSDTSVCGWATVAQETSGEVDAMLEALKTGFDGVVYSSPAAMVQGCDEVLQNEINGIPYSLVGIDHIFNNTFRNTGGNESVWFQNFMPAQQFTDKIYCVVYASSGIDETIPEVADVRVDYTDNTANTTIIYDLNTPTEIIINRAKTISKLTFVGFRSASSTTSKTSTWSMFIYAGNISAKTDKIQTMQNFEGMFQIGAFNGGNKTWVSSPYGIVQRQDYPVRLSAGDICYLTDYTGVHVRFMYLKDGDESRSITSWMTDSYTIQYSGLYWFEVETNPVATITNINDYLAKVRILKSWDFYDCVKENNVENQRTDWIVKAVNHRGMNLLAPENTIPAFKLSARLGFKYVETDIAETSDGVIVLIHDTTINRTARNADGTTISSTINIADITYEQALEYDFGIWKGTQYAGTKIPTLDQFMALCRQLSIHPYLDLGSIDDEGIIDKVVTSVKKHGMAHDTTIIGSRSTALSYVSSLCEFMRIGLIASPTDENITAAADLKNGKNEVFIDAQTGTYSTDAIISALIEAGLPLETYTPNTSDDISNLSPYVTGVTSDNLIAGKVLFENNIDM
jgi:glycerophosphoryl diester phosphodiesterase